MMVSSWAATNLHIFMCICSMSLFCQLALTRGVPTVSVRQKPQQQGVSQDDLMASDVNGFQADDSHQEQFQQMFEIVGEDIQTSLYRRNRPSQTKPNSMKPASGGTFDTGRGTERFTVQRPLDVSSQKVKEFTERQQKIGGSRQRISQNSMKETSQGAHDYSVKQAYYGALVRPESQMPTNTDGPDSEGPTSSEGFFNIILGSDQQSNRPNQGPDNSAKKGFYAITFNGLDQAAEQFETQKPLDMNLKEIEKHLGSKKTQNNAEGQDSSQGGYFKIISGDDSQHVKKTHQGDPDYSVKQAFYGAAFTDVAQAPGQFAVQKPLDMSVQEVDKFNKRKQKPTPAKKTQDEGEQPKRPPRREAPQSVSAVCGEQTLQVTVNMDLLGTGSLIYPEDISLGDCGPIEMDESRQELFFETLLHECGGTAEILEDLVVYSFTLTYYPQPIGDTPIVRTNEATITIECQYNRFHNVSSSALQPTWTPYESSQSFDEALEFSLKLMTDDWQSERPSAEYSLGDMINIEASVKVADHVPLRVYVEECIATMEPEKQSSVTYALINNHGCLADSKLTGSFSQFMPRVEDEKLQLQIEAFKFADATSDSFHLTCVLHAVPTDSASNNILKACHYSMESDWWSDADGHDELCGCCDAGKCPARKGRAAEADSRRLQMTLGPITVFATEDQETVIASNI